MLTRVFLGTNTVKILVAIPLISLLVSCGNNVNSPAGATPSQQRTTSTRGATPSQQATPSSIPQSRPVHSIGFNVAHIHVYSGEGIVCLNYPTINTADPFGLHANLALTQKRLSYDPAEIQEMRTYAAAVYGSASTSQFPEPPSMLSWVQGTRVGDVRGSSFDSSLVARGCFGEIDLTNTGENSILIQSINMQLTAMPVRTDPSYQYRMIDICSLLASYLAGNGCPPEAGGAGPALDFFRLKAAPSGSIFTSKPQSYDYVNQNWSDVILNPNDQGATSIIFYFTSLDNLVYSLEPQLVLKTSNGTQQIVPLPQLATRLYFANLSQFHCYTLKGNIFVEMTKAESLDTSGRAYCV